MIYNFNNISPKLDKDSWYAPNSVLIGNVTLKKDANIWFNATLRGDVEPITIGEKKRNCRALSNASWMCHRR